MDEKAGRRSSASVLGETRTEVQQRLQGEGSRGGITDSQPPVAAPTLGSVMAMLERMSRQQSELQLLTSVLRRDVQHLTGKFYEVLQGVTVPPAGLPTVGTPGLEPPVGSPGLEPARFGTSSRSAAENASSLSTCFSRTSCLDAGTLRIRFAKSAVAESGSWTTIDVVPSCRGARRRGRPSTQAAKY